jgi:hypothetical protein
MEEYKDNPTNSLQETDCATRMVRPGSPPDSCIHNLKPKANTNLDASV